MNQLLSSPGKELLIFIRKCYASLYKCMRSYLFLCLLDICWWFVLKFLNFSLFQLHGEDKEITEELQNDLFPFYNQQPYQFPFKLAFIFAQKITQYIFHVIYIMEVNSVLQFLENLWLDEFQEREDESEREREGGRKKVIVRQIESQIDRLIERTKRAERKIG